MITSPLGLVPRELEDLWPAAHYDIPVTGDWDADELEMVNSMISDVCERVGYSEIINHSGMDVSIEGIACHNTRRGTAGSKESLDELRKSVLKSVEGMNLADKSEKQHRIEVMK